MKNQLIYFPGVLFLGLLASCGESQSNSDSEIEEESVNIVHQEEDTIQDVIDLFETSVEGRMVLACQIGDYQEQALMVLNWSPEDENGVFPIDGYYFYIKHQKNLDLEGYSEPSTREIYLNESYKGKPTGYIMFLQDDIENESYWAPSKESNERQDFNQEELVSGDIYELELAINNGIYTYDHQIEMYNPETDSFDLYVETNELYVSNINDEFLIFDLYVVGNNAHIGSVNGIARINGSSATWISSDDESCQLTFDLSDENEISIKEQNCEYYHGANAYFDGTLTKK